MSGGALIELRRVRQRGQRPHCLAGFTFGDAQLEELLQVQPELGAGAEEVTEPERRVTGDCIAARSRTSVTRLVGTLIRRASFRRAHAEFLELLGQMFARMNCRALP